MVCPRLLFNIIDNIYRKNSRKVNICVTNRRSLRIYFCKEPHAIVVKSPVFKATTTRYGVLKKYFRFIKKSVDKYGLRWYIRQALERAGQKSSKVLLRVSKKVLKK